MTKLLLYGFFREDDGRLFKFEGVEALPSAPGVYSVFLTPQIQTGGFTLVGAPLVLEVSPVREMDNANVTLPGVIVRDDEFSAQLICPATGWESDICTVYKPEAKLGSSELSPCSINWGGIGSQSPARAEAMAAVLQLASELAREFNEACHVPEVE